MSKKRRKMRYTRYSILRIIWRSVWRTTAAVSRSRSSKAATRYAIQWDATYRIEDDAFVVADASGTQANIRYPVADLRVAERCALRQI